jgi:hypothetical protein
MEITQSSGTLNHENTLEKLDQEVHWHSENRQANNCKLKKQKILHQGRVAFKIQLHDSAAAFLLNEPLEQLEFHTCET